MAEERTWQVQRLAKTIAMWHIFLQVSGSCPVDERWYGCRGVSIIGQFSL